MTLHLHSPSHPKMIDEAVRCCISRWRLLHSMKVHFVTIASILGLWVLIEDEQSSIANEIRYEFTRIAKEHGL